MINQQWIAALRSGEYDQCYGRLREGDKYCALGVGCCVLDKAQWTFWRDQWWYIGHTHTPGGFAGIRLGLCRDGFIRLRKPWVSPEGKEFNRVDVVYLNDGLRWSFDEIADFLESDYVS